MKTEHNKGYDVHAPNVARHIAKPLGALHSGNKKLINKRLEIKPAFENRE